MSNRASETKALTPDEDKSLQPAEDKAGKADADVQAPAPVESLPTGIPVQLLHHCAYGTPGEVVEVDANTANQLIVSARAKLV